MSTPDSRLQELIKSRHFQLLDLPALRSLAEVIEEFQFEEGDVVFFEGDEPSGALLVLEGCLEEKESADKCRFWGPGEFWAKERLWSNPAYRGDLKGKTAGRYFQIPRAAFISWLRKYPSQIPFLVAGTGPEEPPWNEQLLKNLLVPLPSSIKHHPRLLDKDEYLIHKSGRSRLYSGMKMALPGFFFFQALAFGLVLWIRFSDQLPLFFLWILPGIVLVVSAFFWLLFYLENRNSFLLLTNRSLILRQLHLWERKSEFQKIPLEKIREAKTVKKNLFDHLFGWASVEIDTETAQVKMVFSGLAGDRRFLQALESARSAVIPGPGVNRQKIRTSLENHFGSGRKPLLISEPIAPPPKKQKRFAWRTEKDHRVRFRRHPWVLWRQTFRWWGLFLLILFVGATAWAVWGEGGRAVFLVCLLFSLVPGGHFLWVWLDWIDDSLFLEGDKIVALHKKPFWRGEIRQEGALDQIQQIGIRKESFTAIALDYGDLVIQLGGGDPLIFEKASHPESVQAEIFRRRQELLDSRRQKEAEARVDEISDVLKAYEQAKDQGFFRSDDPDHGTGNP